MITLKCKECGTDFEAQRTSAKFCSAKCRVKFNNTTEDENPVPKLEPPKVDKVIIQKAKETIKEKTKVDLEKEASRKLFIQKINEQYGAGTVMCMADVVKKMDNAISTGSILLNEALGIGGLPRGRMVEIYGQESSGKTTLATHIIAEAQKKGGMCAIVDVEQAFDTDYAEKLGVNLKMLEISQPEYGEQALEIASGMIESGSYTVVVVDSVAALIPKKELEGESGDSAMGKQAWLMSQACRKMVGSVAKSNTLLIWINQLRSRLGVMPYQSPWITTGGNALKRFTSVRLEIATIAKLKDGEEIIGSRTKVKVVKNKMAPPYKTAEFDTLFGIGIDQVGELLEVASSLQIVNKSGMWYSYNGSKIGQGRDAAKQTLIANPEMIDEIKNKVKNYSPEQN